jgi:hypothetical protein
LLRKASLERSFRSAAAASKAAAAWLGLGLLLADDNPLATLGLIAVLFALAGGGAGRAVERPAALRVFYCLVLAALVRWAAGPLAACLAAGCLAAGWALRVRVRDGILALALVGAGVATVSRPSGHLVLAFATLGALTVAARPLLNAAGKPIQRIRRSLAARRDARLATLGDASIERGTTRLAPAAPMTDVPTLQSDVLEVNR